MHLGEGLLDFFDADRLGDEAVEGQPSLQEQIDQHRKVPRGQAVAVPGGLQRAAAPEHVDQRRLDGHLRIGHADQDHGAGEVAPVEGLPGGLRTSDRIHHDVRAEAAGQLLDRGDAVVVQAAGVDGVGGAQLARPGQLAVVEVNRDDRRRPGQARTGNRGRTHPTATDDRDRVAPPDVAGVYRGTKTGHHAAAQQAGDRGRGRGRGLGLGAWGLGLGA